MPGTAGLDFVILSVSFPQLGELVIGSSFSHARTAGTNPGTYAPWKVHSDNLITSQSSFPPIVALDEGQLREEYSDW